MWIILFPEVTVFDYNVSTILSPIVGLFNGYWQNNAEDNAEVDLLPIEGGWGGRSSIFSRMKCCPVSMANVFRTKLELLNSM